MSKHPVDAIGYIDQLASEINEIWFDSVCNIVLSGRSVSELMESEKKDLIKIFWDSDSKRKDWSVSHKKEETSSDLVYSKKTRPRLEYISNFSNFRGLGPHLKIDFKKRITIVFGENGSGKSSLCEALVALSGARELKIPLWNTQNPNGEDPLPSFKYKVSGQEEETWTKSVQDRDIQTKEIKSTETRIGKHIKLYDSDFLNAKKNISDVQHLFDPIPLSLGKFGEINSSVQSLEELLNDEVYNEKKQVKASLDDYKEIFSSYNNQEEIKTLFDLSTNDKSKLLEFEEELNLLSSSLDKKIDMLEKRRKNQAEAGSIFDKIKKEEAEIAYITVYKKKFDVIKKQLLNIDPQQDIIKKSEQLSELEQKSKGLDHLSDLTIENKNFITILRHLEHDIQDAYEKEGKCPLCLKKLEKDSLLVFKAYLDFLKGNISKKIADCKKHLETFDSSLEKTFTLLNDVNLEEDKILDGDLRTSLETNAKSLLDLCQTLINKKEEEKFQKLYTDVEKIGENITQMEEVITSKQDEIKRLNDLSASMMDPGELQQLLDFYMLFRKNKAKLNVVCDELKKIYEKERRLLVTNFQDIKSKISNKRRTASKKLQEKRVLEILNKQLKELSNKSLSDYGITLKMTTTKGDAKYQPVISYNQKNSKKDSNVKDVLSEGELKMYYIALFFAELMVKKRHIVVFDDPITSLDYKYEELYAKRLISYMEGDKHSQVIIFTHNITFFNLLIEKLKQRNNIKPDRRDKEIINRKIVSLDKEIKRLKGDKGAKKEIQELRDKRKELGNEKGIVFHSLKIHGCNESRVYKDLKFDVMCGDLEQELRKKQTELSYICKQGIIAQIRELIETMVEELVFKNQRYVFMPRSLRRSSFDTFTGIRPLDPNQAKELSEAYHLLSDGVHDSFYRYDYSEERVNKIYEIILEKDLFGSIKSIAESLRRK